MGLATNRSWVTDSGDKKEETEFHRIVAWNKLAELCSNLLYKGRRIYVEGRLQTRQWTGQDGNARQATEIVIEDMLILDSNRRQGEEAYDQNGGTDEGFAVDEKQINTDPVEMPAGPGDPMPEKEEKKPVKKAAPVKSKSDEVAEDIPF
jgi:single-strand DNA-binding protein